MVQFEHMILTYNNSCPLKFNFFLILFFLIISTHQINSTICSKTLTILNLFKNSIYNLVLDTYFSNANTLRKEILDYLISIFCLIFFLNFAGLMPYVFTLTSSLVIPLFLAFTMYSVLNLYSILKLKWISFSAYLPAKEIIWIAPALIIIEYISAISRIISLSLRLFANMVAGHILLKILISFSVVFIETLNVFPYVGLIWLFLSILFVLEVSLSFLQAYVFVLLSAIYLDALQNVNH